MVESKLACPACGRAFPIENGIPRLIISDKLSNSQKRQREAYDAAFRGTGRRRLNYSQLPEADAMQSAAGDCAGETVLDAGCGDGRRTPVFTRAKRFAAVDSSWTALNEFPAALLGANLQRVEADVTRLPFHDGSFDTVLCGQVLPHVEGPEERERLVAELVRVVKPAGRILISTLHFNFRFKLLGLAKEGRNEENCYFYRDTLDEFRALLDPHVEIERMWGYWIYLPRTYPIVSRLGRFIVYWDRIWRTRPLAMRYGKMLLAFCRPRRKPHA